MNITTGQHVAQEHMPSTSEEWRVLDKTLLYYIKNNLDKYSILHWIGGEQELAKDVLQETYARVFRFLRGNSEQEDSPPINNFEAFCKTVAQRYILDLRRKDKRLVGSLDTIEFSSSHEILSTLDDPETLVLEEMTLYATVLTVSKVVKSFPEKQRIALLIDLAQDADFDDESPRPLELAMWAVGIPLREYYCKLPHDPVLRSRHNALVYVAYRRLRLAFNTTSSPLNAAA